MSCIGTVDYWWFPWLCIAGATLLGFLLGRSW
jgi:hypothetical protein